MKYNIEYLSTIHGFFLIDGPAATASVAGRRVEKSRFCPIFLQDRTRQVSGKVKRQLRRKKLMEVLLYIVVVPPPP